jgi:hypothetical protein
MLHLHFVGIITALFIGYRFGDWRNWNKYYPTILFFILGDFIYNVLFHNKMLWLYACPELNHTLIDMTVAFTVFPATVLVFIPYFPKGRLKQAVYILSWTLLGSSAEYTSHILGCFKYDNGWNQYWSILFYMAMFPLLYLHYKKPLLAWFCAIVELMIYLVIFRVDVMRLI